MRAARLGGPDEIFVDPVTGPVYVEGAEPGDALKVTMLSFKPSGWGWSAVTPEFGLLADQFEEPALYIWQYDPAFLPWLHSSHCAYKSVNNEGTTPLS